MTEYCAVIGMHFMVWATNCLWLYPSQSLSLSVEWGLAMCDYMKVRGKL